jgi:manganese/zinc/iron transport system substrate-binding protein
MGDILVKLARQRPVMAVSEEVPQDRLREPPEFQGQYDPHIWFDVSLWAMVVGPIERELSKLRPANADEFRANAGALRKDLEDLDHWVMERIRAVPAAQRVLVTAHDAFGYFGRRYEIEVHGLQGISTVAEAGLKDVEKLVDLIVTRKVKAIFVESSVPRRSIEAVQAACRSRQHDVAIGGQLFSDAMGAAGTPEGTYAGMVRHNVNTVVEALR